MSTNLRAIERNVHFYDASNGTLLGGLVQNGSVTEANFLDMLSMLLVTSGVPYQVKGREDHHVVARAEQSLQLGHYDIFCNEAILVTLETSTPRVLTFPASGREDGFIKGIRNRDKKCVFSGIVNTRSNCWSGFEAVHISPLSGADIWTQNEYGNTNITELGESIINSLQNGFLMLATYHDDWANCFMSVNPDDNYKIVVFQEDIFTLDGKILDPVCRDPQDPHHISDGLLRWHYRQCVLANMKGTGEPIFEHDCSLGSDAMGLLQKEPFGKGSLS